MCTRTMFSRLAAVALIGVTLAGCGSDPSAPATPPPSVDEQIASRLDDISREQSRRGDSRGSREVAWAAMALRAGLEPSELTVRVDGVPQTFQAFAQGLSFPMLVVGVPNAEPRILVAWRRSGDSTYLLTVSSIVDQGTVVHPWSAGLVAPFAPALVSYLTAGREPTLSAGVSGTVSFVRRSLGDPCAVPSSDAAHPPRGVECRLATYAVAFDITVQRLRAGTVDLDPSGPTVALEAVEQVVNGARLVFSCELPGRECP